MNVSFKQMFGDKIIITCLLVIGLLIVFHAFFLLFFFAKLPPFIPLFNQMPWGDERITLKIFIGLPLLVSLIIISINITAAAILYTKIPLISRFLAITTFLVCLLTTLIAIRTVFISL